MRTGMWTRREANVLRRAVPPQEKVVALVRQRRLDLSPLFPSIVVATDKQLVICNRWFMGLKTDITFLPYSHVTSFRMVRGIFFSSVILRIRGSGQEKDYVFGGKEEGVIKGLDEESAIRIITAVGKGIKAQVQIQDDAPAAVPFKQGGNFKQTYSTGGNNNNKKVRHNGQPSAAPVNAEEDQLPLINARR